MDSKMKESASTNLHKSTNGSELSDLDIKWILFRSRSEDCDVVKEILAAINVEYENSPFPDLEFLHGVAWGEENEINNKKSNSKNEETEAEREERIKQEDSEIERLETVVGKKRKQREEERSHLERIRSALFAFRTGSSLQRVMLHRDFTTSRSIYFERMAYEDFLAQQQNPDNSRSSKRLPDLEKDFSKVPLPFW